MPTLFLASTSPRRRALLADACVEFTCIAPGPEEPGQGRPDQRAMFRARGKALGARAPWCDGLILGVDTVVDLDGEEFGRPVDRNAARATLRTLSGRTHQVHTGHCLCRPDGGTVEALASSRVRCHPISPDELESYLDGGGWQGKAGAYGIQDAGAGFVELVEGDLDTVIGLSVAAVRGLLERIPDGAE